MTLTIERPVTEETRKAVDGFLRPYVVAAEKSRVCVFLNFEFPPKLLVNKPDFFHRCCPCAPST